MARATSASILAVLLLVIIVCLVFNIFLLAPAYLKKVPLYLRIRNSSVLKTDNRAHVLSLKPRDGKALYNASYYKSFWKNTKVNNPSMNYVIANSDYCQQSSTKLDRLIYVNSANGNVQRRDRIRKSWAHITLRTRYHVGVVFVVGTTLSGDLTSGTAIEEEAQQFGDIIQVDVEESYKNIGYKAMMALKWIDSNCAHVNYVIKVDDDVIVNVFSVLSAVDSHAVSHKRFVICHLNRKMPVLRRGTTCMKWCVSKQDYAEIYFPNYCSGFAHVMSSGLSAELYNASLYTDYFWVDDVYVTGLVLSRLANVQISEAYNRHFMMYKNPLSTDFSYFFLVTPRNKYKVYWMYTLNHYRQVIIESIGHQSYNELTTSALSIV